MSDNSFTDTAAASTAETNTPEHAIETIANAMKATSAASETEGDNQ